MSRHIFTCLIFIFLFIGLANGAETSYSANHLLIQLPSEKTALINSLTADFSAVDLKPKKLLSARLNIWLFEFDSGQIAAEDVLMDVRVHRSVKDAQFNHFVTLRSNYPNDPRFNNQWSLENTGQSGGRVDADIDAAEAWEISSGGTTSLGDEIVIAIIDNGFDLDHQDLAFWKNEHEIPNNGIDDDGNGYIDDYDGWDAFNSDGTLPEGRHGTHVTGIAAAVGNNGIGLSGINWDAKVLPIYGASGFESVVIESYGYVLEMRARYDESNGEEGAFVVSTNASFGVDFGDPDDYPLWCAIYDSLGQLGILSAGATANRNIDIDEEGDVPTACPSDFLIAVTNTTRTDAKNGGAAYGATTIDLGAPGTDILSTTPSNNYDIMGGTSMATPHVAAAVALMFSAADSLLMRDYRNQPAQIGLLFKRWLLESVDPKSSLENITLTGGRLNVYNALDRVTTYQHATINGTVRDLESGQPLAARVWLTGDNTFETTADDSGHYSLEVIAGSYTLHAYFTLYSEIQIEIQIENRAILSQNIELRNYDLNQDGIFDIEDIQLHSTPEEFQEFSRYWIQAHSNSN